MCQFQRNFQHTNSMAINPMDLDHHARQLSRSTADPEDLLTWPAGFICRCWALQVWAEINRNLKTLHMNFCDDGRVSPKRDLRMYRIVLACRMNAVARLMIATLAFGSMASGQQEPHAQTKVVTACEVLGDINRYADSAVIVVGRMERSVSLIDQYHFLSEDQCEHPVVTHGHVWSNKIQVWTDSDKGMPRPPRAKLQLEQSAVAAKLRTVRQTTKLGTHEEPYFKKDGNSIVYAGQTSRPNEWAVVYGRIARMPNLNEDCGVEGCGGDNVPLMLIAEPYNVRRIAEDGRVLAQRQ